jgi:hypothetical protein
VVSAPTCVRCGRPMPDTAYACTAETTRATAQLAEIAALTGDARAVAYGLSSRPNGSGGSGRPGSRSPGNDDAMDALAEVQNALTTIARDIAETRGLEILPDGTSRPLSVAVADQNGELVPVATPELLETL